MRLAIFKACRRAADLDVAFELEALIVGRHAQRCGLDLLPHHHVIGGKIGGIDSDRIIGRARRQIGLQRHRQRDLRRHRSARRRRIERRAGSIAQPVGGEELGGGRHRPVELEAHPRRRFVRRGVGHFEQAVRHRQLAPGGQIGRALAEHDRGVAPDDVHVEVGIADRRQALDRTDDRAGRDRLERQSVIGHRRAALLEGVERRVDRDDHRARPCRSRDGR